MEFLIKNSKNFVGQEVELKGWVYNKRSSGSIAFLQVRDGSGFIQAVAVKGEMDNSDFIKACEVTLESSVILT